jgi:hypothetical protein
MHKHLLALVLVSVVSGCVTSDGPENRSAIRQVRAQQLAQESEKPVRSPDAKRQPVILGAAY